jgi:hypothetical protein
MLPPKASKHGPSREEAEALATRAFAYLAAEPERIVRFLSLAGIAPDAVRRAATEPGFLPAVLDHFLNDEALLVAFAGEDGIDPAAVAAAKQALGR